MKKLLIGVLSLISFCAFAEDTVQLKVDKSQKHFVVSLDSNPSTGYQWAIQHYDKKRFKLLKTDYRPSKSDLMGAGGKMTFKFALRAKKSYPDCTCMRFKYVRPWENNEEAKVQNVQIHFIAPENENAKS